MKICAVCHQLTDLIGLGFENFDGIGRWRTQENGATIDASGELDGHTHLIMLGNWLKSIRQSKTSPRCI